MDRNCFFYIYSFEIARKPVKKLMGLICNNEVQVLSILKQLVLPTRKKHFLLMLFFDLKFNKLKPVAVEPALR